MASVKDLGKSLGKPKLDMDYDLYSEFKRKEDVPKIALEYLERDIDVVIEAFTKVTEIYDKKLTRASMAYSNFMEFYGDRQFARDFGGMVKNFRSGEREWRNVLT